ncbi:hypothetical protein PR202_ga16119 [Eleusine coracana subsp. coracana]|uniref:Uncharacterized protein n=1 Tax=Eleusine coracana subsp. coracana TaxID=191504 RepID=A0AAV5CKW3_ELECO|nr:hypothetical protein PR202_ga16119 [Eleusine coracana subsp. coracana]
MFIVFLEEFKYIQPCSAWNSPLKQHSSSEYKACGELPRLLRFLRTRTSHSCHVETCPRVLSM